MSANPYVTVPPAISRIAGLLPGSDFYDAWAIEAAEPGRPAIGQFLKAVGSSPPWVNRCMALRNRAAALVGLKDLGALEAATPRKKEADYRPGDRLGIFTIFEISDDEVLAGDRDKHLDVVLSVHVAPDARAGSALVTLTTVVHVKNLLGRIYMLPVAPMHRLIAPAVLKSVGRE